jgi:hypothetical protein
MKQRIIQTDLSMVVTAWSNTLPIDPRSGESIVTAQDLYRLECSLSALVDDHPCPKPNLLSRLINRTQSLLSRTSNE